MSNVDSQTDGQRSACALRPDELKQQTHYGGAKCRYIHAN